MEYHKAYMLKNTSNLVSFKNFILFVSHSTYVMLKKWSNNDIVTNNF